MPDNDLNQLHKNLDRGMTGVAWNRWNSLILPLFIREFLGAGFAVDCVHLRPSDHHAYPTRAYQTLRNFDGLPRLPSGYAGMISIAERTPLWYRLMNSRVAARYGGDLTRANVNPSIRKRILAKYMPQQA